MTSLSEIVAEQPEKAVDAGLGRDVSKPSPALPGRPVQSATRSTDCLAFSVESALQIDSNAYQQEQNKHSASDRRTTQVKTASAA